MHINSNIKDNEQHTEKHSANDIKPKIIIENVSSCVCNSSGRPLVRRAIRHLRASFIDAEIPRAGWVKSC